MMGEIDSFVYDAIKKLTSNMAIFQKFLFTPRNTSTTIGKNMTAHLYPDRIEFYFEETKNNIMSTRTCSIKFDDLKKIIKKKKLKLMIDAYCFMVERDFQRIPTKTLTYHEPELGPYRVTLYDYNYILDLMKKIEKSENENKSNQKNQDNQQDPKGNNTNKVLISDIISAILPILGNTFNRSNDTTPTNQCDNDDDIYSSSESSDDDDEGNESNDKSKSSTFSYMDYISGYLPLLASIAFGLSSKRTFTDSEMDFYNRVLKALSNFLSRELKVPSISIKTLRKAIEKHIDETIIISLCSNPHVRKFKVYKDMSFEELINTHSKN